MAGMGSKHVRWVDLTLSLDTNAYATGDVLADTQEADDTAFHMLDTSIIVQSVFILDKDAQAAALDILFLNSLVTIGTENAAVSVSDANALRICGAINVVAGDYISLGSGSSYALPQFNPFIISAASPGDKSLYVAAIARDTATYAADGLVLRIGTLR
jgi:hypothetical protein